MASQNKTNDKYVKCDDNALVFISAPKMADLAVEPDAALNRSQISFVMDEDTSKLVIIAKNSDGAVKEAEILLSDP